MGNRKDKTLNLQKASHKALLHLLNNIGVIGAALAAFADILFVIIMVVGVKIDIELKSIIIFSVVNALIGIMITVLLRYQGLKYAEIENDELCKRFYHKKVKEKKPIAMGKWMVLKSLQDILIKGCTAAFSIFGIIYISITGSKNPIQILITIATLVLFACFGLISMNSAYCRFYSVQVPLMTLKLEERSSANKEEEPMKDNRKKKKQVKALESIKKDIVVEEPNKNEQEIPQENKDMVGVIQTEAESTISSMEGGLE